ncbi:histidine kinase [Terasakiella brassicae]|uniref:histidine kinase n=2 Tax=Terasakiella brassicae TaxID=1634917 RepID=A0A917C3L6_9PROT|nr:histidine kinase [Terasakiella brassicae]
MFKSSLQLRLILSSLIWTVASLVLTGFLIVSLFEGHIEKRFDNQLSDHLEELVAASDISANGRLDLTWSPSDPRFNRPHSGWYWEILENGSVIHQSSSLLMASVFPKDQKTDTFLHTNGPSGKELRLYSRQIALPRSTSIFIFVVAGPISDMEDDIRTFLSNIVLVLSVLSCFLVGMVFLQIKYGLLPLKRLTQSLALIRSGNLDKMPQDFPLEVQPLASELNTLLDYNFTLLERARTQVGNLAHSLKNPIAVLMNETKDIPGAKGKLIRKHLNSATDSISRYLNKARIAGSSRLLGTKTSLGDVAKDLKFSLEKLFNQSSLKISLSGLDGVIIRADPQDMEELFGNLMENACKWAKNKISISGTCQAGQVLIQIEDDGPGVPLEQMNNLVKRGLRLDETKPGTGLGLHIASEIVDLYGGQLDFFNSDLGGLGVKITLPQAL